MDRSVFDELMSVNVNDRKQKKGKFDYLSWAYAWAEVKQRYPDATSTVYENADGLAYHTDGRTAWVKVGVTINGQEHIEYLAIMDNYNNSMSVDKITSRNVCDSIQRAMVKAIARHGLGLYIYAGEDIPKETPEEIAERKLNGEEVELPNGEEFAKAMKSATLKETAKANKKATKTQVKEIVKIAELIHQPTDRICGRYEVETLDALSHAQADEVLTKLKEAQK